MVMAMNMNMKMPLSLSLFSRLHTIRTIASNHRHHRHHRHFRGRLFSVLTPEQAGRRASEIATDLLRNQQQRVVVVEDDDYENNTVVNKKISTLLSHAGIVDSQDNSPQAPPIHVATTYTRPADGIYKESDFKYARMDNPTRLLLEKTIFDLECINLSKLSSSSSSSEHGTEKHSSQSMSSLAFASGLMAVTNILLAHSSPITILLPDDLYHGTSTLFFDVFARHSHVQTIPVDMSQTSSVIEAISSIATERSDDSKPIENIIVWMESPSNPKCQIVDIGAICNAVQTIQQDESIGRYVKCTTVVDGTMSSPVLTRSLELGADISLHSATKYLGGHSDALLGVLTASPVTTRGQELFPILKETQILAGGVASPWDSWLVLRGLRTLVVRVEQQCRSAMKLAEYFEMQRSQNPGGLGLIHAVHYPGLKSHPQHDVASRQMSGGYGGVLSVELHDEMAATAFAGALQTIHRATSLGGTETLIEHRASVEPPERRVSPPGLLRISVGLEDPDDLIRDIEMALEITAKICK